MKKNKYKFISKKNNEKLPFIFKLCLILFIIGEIGGVIIGYRSLLYLDSIVDINAIGNLIKIMSIALCLIYILNIICIIKVFGSNPIVCCIMVFILLRKIFYFFYPYINC